MIRNNLKYGLAILFIALGIISCKQESLSPKEYINWVEDASNGLLVDKQIGSFVFSIIYKPHLYIALKEISSENILEEVLNKKVEEISDLQYYTMKISTNEENVSPLKYNVRNDAEKKRKTDYFSFNMKDNIYLIDGKDTLPCILFHFERTYELASYNTFVMAFESLNNSINDKMIVFDDNLLGVGKINMIIKENDLKEIPKLKI